MPVWSGELGPSPVRLSRPKVTLPRSHAPTFQSKTTQKRTPKDWAERVPTIRASEFDTKAGQLPLSDRDSVRRAGLLQIRFNEKVTFYETYPPFEYDRRPIDVPENPLKLPNRGVRVYNENMDSDPESGDEAVASGFQKLHRAKGDSGTTPKRRDVPSSTAPISGQSASTDRAVAGNGQSSGPSGAHSERTRAREPRRSLAPPEIEAGETAAARHARIKARKEELLQQYEDEKRRLSFMPGAC